MDTELMSAVTGNTTKPANSGENKRATQTQRRLQAK